MTEASSVDLAKTGQHVVADRNRFFLLLTVASLFPYAFFIFKAPFMEGRVGVSELTALVLFLGANGHVGSSFYFYDDPSMRHFMLEQGRVRFLLLPVALIGLGTLLFLLGDSVVRAHAVTLFWVWQVHHFTRQNNGILAFASRGAGIAPNLAERTALALTNVAGILGALVAVAPYGDTIIADWGWQIYVVGLGAYVAAWISYAISLKDAARRHWSWRPWILLLLMFFYLPLYVFENPFSAVFIFLTAHGLQYLLFMAYVARSSERGFRRAAVSTVFMTFAVGYGVLLLQSKQLAAPWGQALIGAAYGVIIWHFLLDARVWRLSEPFQREYMSERFDFLLKTKSEGASR